MLTLTPATAAPLRHRPQLRTVAHALLLPDVSLQELDAAEAAGAGGGGGRDVDMGAGGRQAAPKEVSYYVPKTAEQLKRVRTAVAEFSFPRYVARCTAMAGWYRAAVSVTASPPPASLASSPPRVVLQRPSAIARGTPSAGRL